MFKNISIIFLFIYGNTCVLANPQIQGSSLLDTTAAVESNYVVESPSVVLFAGTGGTTFSFVSITAEVTLARFREHSALHSLRLSAGIGEKLLTHGFVTVLLRGLILNLDRHVDLGVGCNIMWSQLILSPEQLPMFTITDMGASRVNPLVVVALRHEPRTGGFVARLTLTEMYNVADRRFYSMIGGDFGIAF